MMPPRPAKSDAQSPTTITAEAIPRIRNKMELFRATVSLGVAAHSVAFPWQAEYLRRPS